MSVATAAGTAPRLDLRPQRTRGQEKNQTNANEPGLHKPPQGTTMVSRGCNGTFWSASLPLITFL